MSVEKEIPAKCPRPGPKRHGKQGRGSRGRSKTRGQAASCKTSVRGPSPLEPCCKKEREKEWVPWNGLMVIGKRVELLDRNPQKPRLWDPKFEPEDWTSEGAGKPILKLATPNQESLDAALRGGVAGALQASIALRRNSLKLWRHPEDRGKTRIEFQGEEPRRVSVSEERSKARKDKAGTTGEDLRSRGDQPRQNEEPKSDAEKPAYKKEKRMSTGGKAVDRGERRGSTGEKVVGGGERRGSAREKVVGGGEKRGSTTEKMALSTTRESRRLSREVKSSGEKPRSTGDREESNDEKSDSSGGKLGEQSRTGSEAEEKPERVSDEEKGAGSTDEAEVPSESVEGGEEVEEEGHDPGTDKDEDHPVGDVAGESVSAEEEGEGPKE